MICLDTDFIIEYLNGQQEAIKFIQQIENEGREVFTTAINALEIFVGIVEVSGISSQHIKKTKDFFDNITILNLNKASAERTAYILNTLKKLGTPIGLKDSLVAGIVLENNISILTRNIRHFERIAGLVIETW